jgi:hypothetical protein
MRVVCRYLALSAAHQGKAAHNGAGSSSDSTVYGDVHIRLNILYDHNR